MIVWPRFAFESWFLLCAVDLDVKTSMHHIVITIIIESNINSFKLDCEYAIII